MGKERLTLEKAVELHRELWNWLAKHPLKSKTDWPKWGEVKKKYGYIRYHCFMCEIARRNGNIDCSECPIDWQSKDKRYHNHINCVSDYVVEPAGLYEKYYKARDRSSIFTLVSWPYIIKTAWLARTIANLSLKKKYQELLEKEER